MTNTEMAPDLLILSISLIPAILSISLAFITKNVYVSLGLGLYSGLIIEAIKKGTFFLIAPITSIFELPIAITKALADEGHSGIILQILLISSLIYLLTYTGGLAAFGNLITRSNEGRKSAQIKTWLMGWLVFFDDYANALIVGPVMRSITDKAKVSREKLAFIIDSTAAPVAGLVLISTWIGYEISLISTQLIDIGVNDVSPMEVFILSIPFRFYNILMLIFIIVNVYTKREYGPMLDAERRTIQGKGVKEKGEDQEGIEEVEINTKYKASTYEGIIPIIILIVSSFYFFYISGANADGVVLAEPDSIKNILTNIAVAFSNANTTVVLSQAAFVAIISVFILSGLKGAFKISKGIDVAIVGAQRLIPTAFVLLLAWSLGTIMDADHLNTGNYIANMIGESIPYQIVPLTIFLISGVMAFATGTSYGTMGILFPLAIPLAFATNPTSIFIIITVGAILTGTILGDHCSPISDTTLLSSSGADVDHLDHVRTQMPYALTVGVISAIGYLIVGIFANVSKGGYIYLAILYIALIFLIYLVLRIFGTKVEK